MRKTALIIKLEKRIKTVPCVKIKKKRVRDRESKMDIFKINATNNYKQCDKTQPARNKVRKCFRRIIEGLSFKVISCLLLLLFKITTIIVITCTMIIIIIIKRRNKNIKKKPHLSRSLLWLFQWNWFRIIEVNSNRSLPLSSKFALIIKLLLKLQLTSGRCFSIVIIKTKNIAFSFLFFFTSII